MGVFGALIAHIIEIWIFAFAYYLMVHGMSWGSLEGNFNGSLMDCAYFSFTVYTTVGFGDIEPLGYVRYLTGIESLTGLVLITWTASFLYLEMQKNWEKF
nr:potassium channel family protein [Paraglaciecola marina]